MLVWLWLVMVVMVTVFGFNGSFSHDFGFCWFRLAFSSWEREVGEKEP